MVEVKWYKEAVLKRMAQASTVIVFKTSDPMRLEPWIRFVTGLPRDNTVRPNIILLYRVWSGLYQVVFDELGEIKYEPYTVRGSAIADSIGGLAVVAGVGGGHVRDLNRALGVIDELLNKREGVMAIFWGLFDYGNLSKQEHYNLVKFLRNTIFTPSYYKKGHTIVLFTDTPEAILDDDTLRHTILVEIPPSTKEERIEIIRDIAAKMGLEIDNRELEALAEATRGLILHDVESVALESIFRYERLDLRAMTSYKYDIVRKTGILDIEEPDHGFEAVGGYQVVKEFIRDNVIEILRNPRLAERLGLRPPRGILLFGPPGTGKTWFARALARELQLPFLRLRTERIVSKWYGETARNIAKAIEIAEAVAPAVVFIDEIDRFGRRGHLTEHEESRRAFSILLEWLGDSRRKTIVIGTTNRPQDLDEAFRRVGRFDYMIPFLYPDKEARRQILEVHTRIVRRVPLAKTVDLDLIAEQTEYWTGAELEELVLRAARAALKEKATKVTMKHFNRALKTFRINEEERLRQLREYTQLALEFTNDAEFLENLTREYSLGSRVEAALRAMKAK